MEFIYKKNLSNIENDQDDREIDSLLSIAPSQLYQAPSLFAQQSANSQRDSEIVSYFSRISQKSHNLQLLQNTLSRHMTEMPSASDQLFTNLKKKYSLLLNHADTKEEFMSRTNSSQSYQSKPLQNRRVVESESGEEQQLYRDFNYYNDDDEDDDIDDESILEEDEKNQSNMSSPIKYHNRYQGKDSIKEYDDGSYNIKGGADNSLISQEQMQGYMKLDPVEKLATFKKYKQTFLRQPTQIVRQFFCEVLYDKIEEEKIIKTRYISKVVGFILASEGSFTHKILVKMIEERDLRSKKVKDSFKLVTDEEHFDRTSIKSYHSLYRIQKFKDELESLRELKDDEKKSQKENSILKDLLSRKNEIINYENCEEFKGLVEQIIVQKAERFYDFSNSAKLIASFMLNLNLTLSVLIKYLLDNEKLQSMCSSAIDIIRAVSINHKYDAPQSE